MEWSLTGVPMLWHYFCQTLVSPVCQLNKLFLAERGNNPSFFGQLCVQFLVPLMLNLVHTALRVLTKHMQSTSDIEMPVRSLNH